MGQIVVQWLIQQGPAVAIAITAWWFEHQRAERLARDLEECHKRERAEIARTADE